MNISPQKAIISFLIIIYLVTISITFGVANNQIQSKPSENHISSALLDYASRQLNHAKAMDQTLAFVGVFLILITCLITVMGFYLEYKRRESHNRFVVEYSEFKDEVMNTLDTSASDIQLRVENIFVTDLRKRITKTQLAFEQDLRNDYEETRLTLNSRLMSQIDTTVNQTIRIAQLAEIACLAQWKSALNGMENSLNSSNWTEFIQLWNNHLKFQRVLSYLRSPVRADIFSGLGLLNAPNFAPNDIPDELKTLLDYLQEIGRLSELDLTIARDELYQEMNWTLLEEDDNPSPIPA